MTFSNYLKYQLTDLVDTYQKFYKKPLGATVIFSLLTLIAVAILLHFSIFDRTGSKRHISLLSYFFVRYSFGDTYSIVDLSKTTFIFFVSVFSVSLIRLQTGQADKKKFNFTNFIVKLTTRDFSYF
jgi:hypothetical protein